MQPELVWRGDGAMTVMPGQTDVERDPIRLPDGGSSVVAWAIGLTLWSRRRHRGRHRARTVTGLDDILTPTNFTSAFRPPWRICGKMLLMTQASENSLQGDYGETWLRAVAASCGLLHGRPTTLDLEKADVELVRRGLWNGMWHPTVKVQVKTTVDLRQEDNHFVYDLDIETYNVLRRDNETVRRVLAVFRLPRRGEKVRLLKSGTLLVGSGAWVSLEGQPATSNTASRVVRLPVDNAIDRPGLERMLATYGVRSSTPVPEVAAWGPS